MPTHVISAHNVQYSIRAEDGSLINQRIQELDGPYEDYLLEHIWGLGLQGTAIDVGAHIGNHTLWFALVCKMSVVAFEPLFHEELKRNLEINSGNPNTYSIRVEPVALGAVAGRAATDGQRVLTAPGAPRGPGTAEGRLIVGDGPIHVEMLDSYDLKDIALIKIDVEGMEPAVLMGAAETIQRELPVIFAEAPDSTAHLRLAEVLEPWGYQKTARFKKGTPIDKWEPVT